MIIDKLSHQKLFNILSWTILYMTKEKFKISEKSFQVIFTI